MSICLAWPQQMALPIGLSGRCFPQINGLHLQMQSLNKHIQSMHTRENIPFARNLWGGNASINFKMKWDLDIYKTISGAPCANKVTP